MTPAEVGFLLRGFEILLGILGFIGALAVYALLRMAKDINEIKTELKIKKVEHDNLEQRVADLEEVVEHKKR